MNAEQMAQEAKHNATGMLHRVFPGVFQTEPRRWIDRYGDDLTPDDPIEQHDLSVRVTNRLPQLGVRTLRDVTKLRDIDILRAQGLGRHSLYEIIEYLREYDLTLRNRKRWAR